MKWSVVEEEGEKFVKCYGFVRLEFGSVIYCPWTTDDAFQAIYQDVKHLTSVSVERLWVLYLLAKQSLKIPGDFVECGVYQGGTARLLAHVLMGSGKKLHLFDTFMGMPLADVKWDVHRKGDFYETSLEEVQAVVGHEDMVVFHKGFVPETFLGLNDLRPAFVHLDLDLRQSTWDALEFIYPRMPLGASMVIDDYGQGTCPGLIEAVDRYFEDKRSVPLSLLGMQAVIFKI